MPDFTSLPIADLPTTAPAAPAPAAPTPAPAQSHLPDTLFFLPECATLPPEKRALVMTLRIDAILHELFAGDEGFGWIPVTPYQAMVMLWMCCHKKEDWNIPAGPAGQPLYLRPFDLVETAQSFFEEHYPTLDAVGLIVLNLSLWNHHKGAEVVIDPTAQTGPVAEKKRVAAAIPTPSTSSSTSSPAETRSSGTKRSTSRSGKRSQPATATLSRQGSPASRRQPSPSVARKPVTASKKQPASGKRK